MFYIKYDIIDSIIILYSIITCNLHIKIYPSIFIIMQYCIANTQTQQKYSTVSQFISTGREESQNTD